ncbi:MAG TPA: hypothetical protein VF145_11525 [Chitinophagaceae bacterium]
MKKIIAIAGITLCAACNVSTDEHDNKDSARNGVDSFIRRADTTLENIGDSVKAKYKDIKRGVKNRLDKDDPEIGDSSGR